MSSYFSSAGRLRDRSSAIALSAVLVLTAIPASADPLGAVFGGGGEVGPLVLRRVFDCRADHRTGLGGGFEIEGDWSCYPARSLLTGLVASVGQEAGLRAFVSNDPDQLFGGVVNGATTAVQSVLLPSDVPPATDQSLADPAFFGRYPYPHLDFAVSLMPLPKNIVVTSGAPYSTSIYHVDWTAGVARRATSTAAYDAAHWGAPIQLPLFMVAVGLMVDLPVVGADGKATVAVGGSTVTWTINSQLQRSPIQFSTAQICAIFSGLVTDWSDASTDIPYLTSDGSRLLEKFSTDNVSAHARPSAPPAYVDASTPIKIVYRSDRSGVSYILTNYLKTVCPLLTDEKTEPVFKYKSIFSFPGNLPSDDFSQLIANVAAAGRSLHTVGASGPEAELAAVGGDAAHYGFIGYVSADQVQQASNAATRPDAASVQNDYMRYHHVYHPGNSPDTYSSWRDSQLNFRGVDDGSPAWSALPTPSPTWTYNDYNVSELKFPAGAVLPGTNISIAGLSILPLTAANQYVYPIVGAAYGFFYSCYGDVTKDGYSLAGSTRAAFIKDMLIHYYRYYPNYSSYVADLEVSSAVRARNFGVIPPNWAAAIDNQFLTGANPSVVAYPGAPFTSCYTVTGGAG